MRSNLARLAFGRNIVILVILYILMVNFVLNPAQRHLEAHSTGKPPLDLHLFYGPDDAYPELVQLDEEG